MSFLANIAQENVQHNHEALIESVINQLIILFSNRNDKYYAYDFKEAKVVAIHEIFQLDYAAPEFAKALVFGIKAFDARLFDIKLSVSTKQNGYSLFIECKATHKDITVEIPQLAFDL